MNANDIFEHTFLSMRRRLGLFGPHAPHLMWQQRLSCQSVFCRALVACGYMSRRQMCRAALYYRLGMSRDGGVIFWQIDELDRTHDGKIMYYRTDCHRDHDRQPSWVSYRLRRAAADYRGLAEGHCLFGLHLLRRQSWKTVAVVEAEKTAVIMSALCPQYLWLATGGLGELSVARLRPLSGRRVMLFPDTDVTGDTYRRWYDVALAASDVFARPVTVSSLLEQRATAAQKAAKIDIVDLIFKQPTL